MTDRTCYRRYLQYISLAVLSLLVLLTYSNRVDNVDFWWHLRSGQFVVQQHSLPKKDSFSYTTGTKIRLTARELKEAGIKSRPSSFPYWQVNLRHSWLGQALFYLVYKGAGFPGIALFKALVFVLCFLVLYWAMRRKGAGTLSSLSTLFLIIVIGQDFASSRPQFFSFFFLAVLIALLVDFKKGGKKIFILPGCFLIWQNLHGGFVVGSFLLLIFYCSEIGKYILHKKFNIFNSSVSDKSSIKFLSYTTLCSAAIMLVNPNTYKVFLVPFAIKRSLFAVIEEYARPMLFEFHAYWLMFFLVLFFFIVLIRINDITDVLLVSFLLISSQLGLRAIILFAIGSGPFVAASATNCWHWLRQRRWPAKFLKAKTTTRLAGYQPLNILFLLLVLYFGVHKAQAQGFLDFSLNNSYYPGKAVKFLKKKNYPGRLFNAYNWGGYLIWNYPERQVFIDGRCLDENAFFQYRLIMSAAGEKSAPTANDSAHRPLWKKLLAEYRVQIVLTNAVTSYGQLVQLVDKLSVDPDWALVYQDGTALIFLRNTPENRRRYGKDFLPKVPRIYDEIIGECQAGIAKHPATWNYYKLLGSIYLIRQDLPKARAMDEKYLSLNPDDREVRRELNMIRSFYGEAPLKNGNNPLPFHHW